MNTKRMITVMMALGVLTGCDDELVRAGDRSAPIAPREGVQAFLQVDNEQAGPGQTVRIWVQVQLAPSVEEPVASYTGRLFFDPGALALDRDVSINDGLRVVNSNGAEQGEIRFAGAQAGGFENLTLYEGTFTVRETNFVSSLRLQMDELSGADLTSYTEALEVEEQVFVRTAGN